jgi:hypothetical protein
MVDPLMTIKERHVFHIRHCGNVHVGGEMNSRTFFVVKRIS